MFGFGKAPPPPKLDLKEQVKEWQSGLKAEMRGLDRQVREVQRDEAKLKREILTTAKKDPVVTKMLAKNVVRGLLFLQSEPQPGPLCTLLGKMPSHCRAINNLQSRD